jgi:hypothetical protein
VVSVGFSSEERFGVEVVRELLVEKDASLLYEQCDDSRGKGLFKQLLGVPVRLGVCESLLLFVGVPARKLSTSSVCGIVHAQVVEALMDAPHWAILLASPGGAAATAE